MRLTGKAVIVTGAGSGFGTGIAQRFAEEGAKLVLNDINAPAVNAVASELKKMGAAVEVCPGDVSEKATWNNLITSVVEKYTRLDVIVNNAGWTYNNKSFLDISEEEFDRVFAINLKSIFFSAQSAIPQLRKSGGGAFIQIGSTMTRRPLPGLGVYGSTKSALIALSLSMAAEFGPENIRFNVINPALGVTGLLTNFTGERDNLDLRQRFTAAIPLRRLTTPADIANAALFLASDEAAFITGAVLQVDGGRAI